MDETSLVGRSLLHYKIEAKIGEGGMGAVYRATDTHLDRPVAIKVLPPDKVADPDRKARFVQEAKAASALRHPNIVVIHDIAFDGGLDFIVMELVEGQSLDELIGRHGLKLAEALSCAVQIADGLAKAHGAGIIHRDIKPSNVMVTPEGLVKILDFGLAKLTEHSPASTPGPTMTLEAETKPRTGEGFIVGTAAYMSPEQAEGGKVDARSDIFSFGSVLYEMLTGHKAFSRESQMKTLAAVLSEEPKPASSLSEAVPSELERVINRCLRKDPQRRWQTMSDLKVALQDLKEDSESGRLQASPQAARAKRKPLLPIIASLALIVAAALFLKFIVLGPAGPVEYEITPLTFDSGFTGFPTLPWEGNLMVYSSDRGGGDMDLWVQHLAGGQPRRLTEDPFNDWYPSFSPDGSQVVFGSERDGGGIYIVDPLGASAPRRIADKGFGPRFSPDGRWIIYVVVPASLESSLYRMFLVSPTGGEKRPFHPELYPTYIGQGGPLVWSPDGKWVLFRGRRQDDPESADWWVAPVDGGEAVRTHAAETVGVGRFVNFPVGWIGDVVYFVSGTTIEGVNLFRIRIDPKSREIQGPAEPVTSGPGMKIFPSVMPDGRVVFTDMTAAISIWSITARTDDGQVSGEPEKLTGDLMQKFSPTISRDGARVAFLAFGGAQQSKYEARIKDLRTGLESVYPLLSPPLSGVVISPDGTRLAYMDIVDGKLGTYLREPASASGRELCAGCSLLEFFPDNKSGAVLIDRNSIGRMDLQTGQVSPLLTINDERLADIALSPDAKWLAARLDEPDGRAAIRLFFIDGPPGGRREKITIAEGDSYLSTPAWSPNGRWLYYLSERTGRTTLMARDLDPRSKEPVGPERELFASARANLMLNFPKGNGRIAVASDRIIFTATEARGNIFVAAPKKKR
jgi:Tol biopolymer transport system component